jgi:hypothetical protein
MGAVGLLKGCDGSEKVISYPLYCLMYATVLVCDF